MNLLASLRQHKFALAIDLIKANDLCTFLLEWFLGHTVEVDKKMAEHLNRQAKDSD